MAILKEKSRQEPLPMGQFQAAVWGLHLLAVAVLGAALFPAVYFLYGVWKFLGASASWMRILAFSFSLSFGYFLFGISLIFLCVLAKNIFGFKISPGLIVFYSKESIRWMGYNSLILVANGAFLDVLRISPFQTLFYRLMGAKVGKNVHVNTSGLADLSMLEIGGDVIIGGGVALICHAADRGFIRLLPTKIGNQVSIGISSIIMPGCEIGDGAVIAPCSYVPKGTKIPPRGYFGGNPLKDLRAERRTVPT